MRKAIFIVVATAGLSLIPATAALADSGGVKGGPGYHPPPAAVANSCNSGHGAFGAFGGKDNNLGTNSPNAAADGGMPGSQNPHNDPGSITTGQNNSDFSQFCSTQ